jgi:hypothetical protein
MSYNSNDFMLGRGEDCIRKEYKCFKCDYSVTYSQYCDYPPAPNDPSTDEFVCPKCFWDYIKDKVPIMRPVNK